MAGSFTTKGRLSRRGFLVMLGLVAIAVGISSVLVVHPRMQAAELNETQRTAFQIRSAAHSWQVLHGDSVCPSLRQLIEGRHYDPKMPRLDPWQQPFTIGCKHFDVIVRSFGPDGKEGTSDDIVAQKPEGSAGAAEIRSFWSK
jgi:hypothetical protein